MEDRKEVSMTENIMCYWLIIYEDDTTAKQFALTPERAIEIERTIANNQNPIKAIIKLHGVNKEEES